jgi:hypothetical protein
MQQTRSWAILSPSYLLLSTANLNHLSKCEVAYCSPEGCCLLIVDVLKEAAYAMFTFINSPAEVHYGTWRYLR